MATKYTRLCTGFYSMLPVNERPRTAFAIVNMLRYCTNLGVIERFALFALVIGVDGIVTDGCEQ